MNLSILRSNGLSSFGLSPLRLRLKFAWPSLLIGLVSIGLLAELSLRGTRKRQDPQLSHLLHSNWSLYSTDLIRPASESRIGFLLKPNLQTFYKGKNFTTNSQGFRDRNRTLLAPPQVRRIAVLGRSYEMGTAVGDHEAWPRVLETLLLPRNIEVLNFGIEGHGLAAMETVYHRYAKNYKPDWVILPIYYEEIDSMVPTRTPSPPFWLKKWTTLSFYLDALYLPRFLQFLVWQHILSPNLNDWEYLPRTDRLKTLGTMTSSSSPKIKVEPYIQVIQRLVASIQKGGSQVIILPLPRVIPPYPVVYSKGRRLYQAYAHHRKGVTLFAELESLQAELTPKNLDIPGDPHFNADFHNILAHKVFGSFATAFLNPGKT